MGTPENTDLEYRPEKRVTMRTPAYYHWMDVIKTDPKPSTTSTSMVDVFGDDSSSKPNEVVVSDQNPSSSPTPNDVDVSDQTPLSLPSLTFASPYGFN
jgi:proteasome lid subunit RPN8/RPN11